MTSGDVELLHARYLTYAFTRHTHEGAAVGVIEEGLERFYYRGAIHTAGPGQIVTFNPSEVPTGEAADENGWRFRMFYLDASLLRQAAAGISDRPREIPFFASPILEDVMLAKMLRKLHVSLEKDGSALARQSKFIWTFARLAQRHADDKPVERAFSNERSVVKLLREYLEDHCTQNISLHKLTQISGLSPYHLIRVFRTGVGLPPHAFLEQIRVNRARQFLRNGASITDVAFATGFTDQSHLTRHFKRMTGVTPGQYQQTAITYKTRSPPKTTLLPVD